MRCDVICVNEGIDVCFASCSCFHAHSFYIIAAIIGMYHTSALAPFNPFHRHDADADDDDTHTHTHPHPHTHDTVDPRSVQFLVVSVAVACPCDTSVVSR